MDKWIFNCPHAKCSIHAHYSLVKPPRVWDNDVDKFVESRDQNEDYGQTVESDENREKMLTENRMLCRK